MGQIDDHRWECIDCFFSKAFRHTVWIVQEIILGERGKRAIIVIGTHMFVYTSSR